MPVWISASEQFIHEPPATHHVVTIQITPEEARELSAAIDKTREPTTVVKRWYNTLLDIAKASEAI